MREKLMNIVCDSIATDRCVAYCSHPHCGLVHTVVQKLIANGVTIPVRCKDCKHFAETKGKDSGKPCGYGKCMKPFFIQMIVDADDFCSYGERRTDDERTG